jgi:hypothetical protein
VESVATRVGFSSATAFREHFQRVVATNPQAYRRAFRSRRTSAETGRPQGRGGVDTGHGVTENRLSLPPKPLPS